MEIISYPQPMPDPIFTITKDEWSNIESDTSAKILVETRRFIICYCNLYIYEICKFYVHRNNINAMRELLRVRLRMSGVADSADE